MKRTKIVALMVAVVLVVMAFVGCATTEKSTDTPSTAPETTGAEASSASEASDAGAASGEHFTIGFSNAGTGNPWRASMVESVEMICEEYGDEITLINCDANFDVTKQLADCEDLLQQNIDALVLAPAVSDALAPVVDMCNEAGVPVIVFDRTIDNDNYTAYVATDNHDLAIPVANYIVDTWPDGANIFYISGTAGAGADTERTEGLMSVIGDKPQYKILGQTDGNWNEADALAAAEDALQAYPDIDILLCSDGCSGLGAWQAVVDAGRQDEITLVCFDAWRNDCLKAIEDGTIAPYTTMLPTYVGAVAVQTAVEILKGNEVVAENKYVSLPCPILTSENYKDYWDQSLPDTEYSWKPGYEMFMNDEVNGFATFFTKPLSVKS